MAKKSPTSNTKRKAFCKSENVDLFCSYCIHVNKQTNKICTPEILKKYSQGILTHRGQENGIGRKLASPSTPFC